VIAEGVETLEQLDFLKRRKCQQVQGYYFAKPLDSQQFEAFIVQSMPNVDVSISATGLISETAGIDAPACVETMQQNDSDNSKLAAIVTPELISDISITVPPVNPGDKLACVLKRFQNDPSLSVLPVVDEGRRAVGIINRSTFLEEHVIGTNGFGYHINHTRTMRDLMDPVKLELDANLSIRDAAQAMQSQGMDVRFDNICVSRSGIYHGIVDVNRLISSITEINLILAKGANPLTGLPGNESIQREINQRLSSGEHFDIAYIDIDNFKPYNDYYGFERGDMVIKAIGEIISKVAESATTGFACFCGHIGGDDFIVITAAHHSEYIAQKIIKAVDEHLPLFHGQADYSAGSYTAVNRKGEQETFGLLSISTGIVNTQLTPVSSYALLASISTEVKKAAKKIPGSSVVVNRREIEQFESQQFQIDNITVSG
jgi:diguanylate cyclase (GGDEF)-like protein